jgi:transcriptional regulator with AAA-type ATPase domain
LKRNFLVPEGAITGATGRKEGLLELTSGRTLFLDEIGDLG